MRTAQIGPTVFPIMYATIVGRACKSIFAWRLERGANIGTLDLLVGSTSLSSAVLTHLTLRLFTIISPALILIWVLSPVGSQAALRVVAISNSTTTTAHEYTYMTQNSSFADHQSADVGTQLAVVQGLIQASILAPASVKASPRDLWGNIKTPMVEEFEQDGLKPTNEGWYSIGDRNTTTYSSLVGMPVLGASSEYSHATFEVETSYWHLDCPVISEGLRIPGTSYNMTEWQGALNTIGSNSSRWRNFGNGSTETPRFITYSSINNDDAASPSKTTGCMRSDPPASFTPAKPPASWTYLDQGGVFMYFSNSFGRAIQAHPGEATAMQIYFIDPDNPYNFGNSTQLFKLDKHTYAVRLAQLLNSYWTAAAGFAFTETTGGSATATIAVIQCNHTWVALLMVASATMIIACLARPVLRLITKAPDLDLSISFLVRDNRYVRLPPVGSAKDASTTARELKSHRIRYGDVHPSESVGHLAIASTDAGYPVGPVQRDRYYD
ncbi:hypothetical protein PG984_011300 [Apiospora sp. TS-2023a]